MVSGSTTSSITTSMSSGTSSGFSLECTTAYAATSDVSLEFPTEASEAAMETDDIPPGPPRARHQTQFFPTHLGRPGMVHRVDLPGGILDSAITAEAIAQQCNCVGVECQGLAAALALKYPYGNPYAHRWRMTRGRHAVPEHRPCPGFINVCRPPLESGGPTIINMFAQWKPGRALCYNRTQPPRGLEDSQQQRGCWFADGLRDIAAITPPLVSIAFPQGIGCVRGGGHWARYESMITNWAWEHPSTVVTIVNWARNVPRPRDTATSQQDAPDRAGAGGEGARHQARHTANGTGSLLTAVPSGTAHAPAEDLAHQDGRRPHRW